MYKEKLNEFMNLGLGKIKIHVIRNKKFLYNFF